MRKLICMLFLLPILSFAQENTGIDFLKNKTWTETLALAKAENKLIFIDVYTDWCGPCRAMDEQVFPLADVAAFYNRSFINYKINAEKGEGVTIAKKYFVQSYPNYIFINGKGQLVHRVTGYQEARKFIEAGKMALSESKQNITLLTLEAQYPIKKKDKEFMFTYLERLTKVKAPTTVLLEEYLKLLSKTEQSNPKIIALIANNATNSNNQIRLGPIFDVMKSNETVMKQLVDNKSIQSTSLSSLKELAMETSLSLAIKQKNEALFQKVREVAASFSEDKFENKFTVDLTYYLGTKNYAKYSIAVQDFVNNYVLKIPADSLQKWDARVYKEVKDSFVEEFGAKPNLEEELFPYLHTQTIQANRTLSQLAENLLKVGTTASEFEQAKEWANHALGIAKTNRKYYENVYPSFHRVYTIALYKTGQKQEAIKQLEQIIQELSEHMKRARGEQYIALLEQMKANKDI